MSSSSQPPVVFPPPLLTTCRARWHNLSPCQPVGAPHAIFHQPGWPTSSFSCHSHWAPRWLHYGSDEQVDVFNNAGVPWASTTSSPSPLDTKARLPVIHASAAVLAGGTWPGPKPRRGTGKLRPRAQQPQRRCCCRSRCGRFHCCVAGRG